MILLGYDSNVIFAIYLFNFYDRVKCASAIIIKNYNTIWNSMNNKRIIELQAQGQSLYSNIYNGLTPTAGINLTQYMGGYYSLNEGRRRYNYCYPPSHNYNNPLFKYYNQINIEMGRLNAVSAASVIDSKIFLVLPVVSEQIDRMLQPVLDLAWHSTANALVYGRYEYDVASERALDGAKIKNGKMVINGFEYEQIIISAMHYTSDKFIKLIKKYIKAP